MQGTPSGHWKRPITRMYSYNHQVGESYYMPMSNYIEKKHAAELPGPLCFSERIAVNALNDVKTKVSFSREITSVVKSSTIGL